MKRRPSYPVPSRLRPTTRHIWRNQVRDEGDLLFRVRGLADQGDRINLIRGDGKRFTLVRNGERFLVRDDRDEPIGTFDSGRDALADGDAQLDARDQDDNPRGAA